MPTLEEITDPHLWSYVPVPPVGAAGICDVCHGAPNPGWSRCYSCAQAMAQVSHPCPLVVPISLSEPFGQLHHVLKHYKNPEREDRTRNSFSTQVAAIVARFLREHQACIRRAAESDWDSVSVVPSSTGRRGTHPLVSALARSRTLRGQLESVLAPGAASIGHNTANDDGYRVTRDVSGRSFLIVDDTFTSGARSQSAASALERAGAQAVAIVPVARLINAHYNDSARDLWTRSSARQYDFGYCCLGSHPAPPLRDL